MALNEEDKTEQVVTSEGDVLAEVLNNSANRFNGFVHKNLAAEVADFMTDELRKTLGTRERYYNQLSQYRWNYITSGIYDIICNDVLGSDELGGFIVKIEDNEELTAELQNLIKVIGIPKLLRQILPEALHYGSYPLKPNLEDGEGLLGLVDDLDAKDVISIQDSNGFPLLYFITESTIGKENLNYSQARGKVKFGGPSAISELSIDDSFIKLKIPDKVSKELKRVLIQEYGDDSELAKTLGKAIKVRTPLSIIWGVLDKLKNTLMMDKINTYKSLSNLLSPTVLGIPLPANNDVKQMANLVQKYDTMINTANVSAVDLERMNFNLQDISTVKVIPISGDRSVPQVVDTGKSDNLIESDRIRESVETTLQSIGIPPEAFFGGTNGKDNLKINIRYAKKIKRIGTCLCDWLKYLFMLHLAYKYEDLDLDYDDLEVSMRSTINTDALENLESQDLIVTSINNVFGLIDSMRETVLPGSGYKIDNKALVENIQSELRSIGSVWQNVFVPGTEPTPEEPNPNEN